MVKITKSITIVLSLIFLIIKCANQLPPGGGEVDRTPPEIIETYPSQNTTNFSEDYFEIEFSEYVDKRSFRDALFISPNIEGRLLFDWTGTTVTVEFEKGLEPDITYTVTVGTDLVDLNNKNRMSSSYSFAFSTGNTIDRRSISGRVFADDPEGILIYAYKLGNGSDTLLERKPNYVSQTGKDGTFKLNGLSESIYRLFAVKDEYRDLLYSLDQDMIGVPYEDINLTGQDSIYSGMKYKLFKADTSAPRLLKAIMTDKNHILVTVSEKLNKEVINAQNFYLIDSTDIKKLVISHSFVKYGKFDEIVLVLSMDVNINNSVFLFAETLGDTFNNNFSNDYLELTLSDRPDTTAVHIIATIPQSGSSSVDFDNPEIKLFFEDAIRKEDIVSAISFIDTLSNEIDFEINFMDDASINIIPTSNLIPEKNYIIKCDLSHVMDIPGNSQDSIYELKFKTISGLDYTGVSGIVINYNSTQNNTLVLESIDISSPKYQEKILKDNFSFENVKAGKYRLWCYIDSDSSGNFNYGWPQPIEYSEQFFVYSDTLKLKPRWTITDVIFDLEK